MQSPVVDPGRAASAKAESNREDKARGWIPGPAHGRPGMTAKPVAIQSMIPKSGNRFSDKIMLTQEIIDGSDSTQLDQTLMDRDLKWLRR
jgi:hypothetical protein